MNTVIFDLDHTVICSAHRKATKADGSLDLEHWIANSTPAKIMADSLLPLASQWHRILHKKNRPQIVVCTARVMGYCDHLFLHNHGLKADKILSRAEGDRSNDAQLKVKLLTQYAISRGQSWADFVASAMMFDDNQAVIERLSSMGLKVYDALKVNEALERRALV